MCTITEQCNRICVFCILIHNLIVSKNRICQSATVHTYASPTYFCEFYSIQNGGYKCGSDSFAMSLHWLTGLTACITIIFNIGKENTYLMFA